MIDGKSSKASGRFFPRFQFMLLVLWLSIGVGHFLIATDDRLVFFFVGTVVGNLADLFWLIYFLCAPVWLVFAVLVRSLKQATMCVGILLVGLAVLGWGTPVDDSLVFRSRLPAYRQFLTGTAEGRCSPSDAWQLGIHLDALACDKPQLFVFPWGGFLSAWQGAIYDETDEIAKLPEKRSPEWKSREAARLLSCIGVDRAVGGHFYIASGNFAC